MAFLIFVCLAAFIALLFILRRDRVSLGLPIAYLYSLLLIHVPGAFAHIAGRDFLLNSDLVELAMRFTAVRSICFIAGVWLASRSAPRGSFCPDVGSPHFCWCCLIGRGSWIERLRPLCGVP